MENQETFITDINDVLGSSPYSTKQEVKDDLLYRMTEFQEYQHKAKGEIHTFSKDGKSHDINESDLNLKIEETVNAKLKSDLDLFRSSAIMNSVGQSHEKMMENLSRHLATRDFKVEVQDGDYKFSKGEFVEIMKGSDLLAMRTGFEEKSVQDVPWDDLKSVGINQNELKKSDVESLKAGGKTEMINMFVDDKPANRELLKKENIDFKEDNGKLSFEGKVSALKYMTADNLPETKEALKKNNIDFSEQGNKIKLEGVNVRKALTIGLILVSPIAGIALLLNAKRKEIKNDMALTKSEIKQLKNGDLITKTTANNEKVLMQVDKDTNELVRVKGKDISIPNSIGGVALTPVQKEALKNGKEINIFNEKLQTSAFVKLDLNAKNGISIKDSNEQKIEANINNAKVAESEIVKPDKITDAKERLEYISDRGVRGVHELFGFGQENRERDEFLQKHDLATRFEKYENLDNEYTENSRADNHDSCRNISKQMNELNAEFKNVAKEQSVSLSETVIEKGNRYEEFVSEVQRDNAIIDKRELEFVAKKENGIPSLHYLFNGDNEKIEAFAEKHNLTSYLEKYNEQKENYLANQDKIALEFNDPSKLRDLEKVEEVISGELKKIDEDFRIAAKEQSISLGEPVVEKVNRDEEFVKTLSDRNFGKLELETFDGWMPSDRTMETVQELPNLNNEEKEMIKNIYSHTTGEEALHVKGEMLNELQRDNAITDKEKLEFVAKKENGIVSLSYLFKGDNEKIDAFVEKHNLTSHYEKYNEQIKGYFEKISNGNKSLIDGELKKINDDFKIAAKEQSVKVTENVYGASYGAAYGKKETNTAKMSL